MDNYCVNNSKILLSRTLVTLTLTLLHRAAAPETVATCCVPTAAPMQPNAAAACAEWERVLRETLGSQLSDGSPLQRKWCDKHQGGFNIWVTHVHTHTHKHARTQTRTHRCVRTRKHINTTPCQGVDPAIPASNPLPWHLLLHTPPFAMATTH